MFSVKADDTLQADAISALSMDMAGWEGSPPAVGQISLRTFKLKIFLVNPGEVFFPALLFALTFV